MFEKLPTVRTADELMDKAFRRATRARRGKETKDVRIQQETMLIVSSNIITDNLRNTVRHFPSFENLPPFYHDMAEVIVGIDRIRKSLGAVDWAAQMAKDIGRTSIGEIRKAQEPMVVRKRAYGRMGSVLGRISDDLLFLNEARNKLRNLPTVGAEPTIVVAGYPNVGKSSFVAHVSSAKPEIAAYPFTTRGVQVGHFTRGITRYQIIDTPGLLDRPLAQRKPAEMLAINALNHLGDVLLFIVDASEFCGYDLSAQFHLLEEVEAMTKIPVIVVANKTDVASEIPNDVMYNMCTLNGEHVDTVLDALVIVADDHFVPDMIPSWEMWAADHAPEEEKDEEVWDEDDEGWDGDDVQDDDEDSDDEDEDEDEI